MGKVADIKETTGKITLADGKEYVIGWQFRSLEALEEQYGDANLAIEAYERGSLKARKLVIWAALVPHNPEMTPEMVSSLLPLRGLTEIYTEVARVIMANSPEGAAGDEKNGEAGTAAEE